MKGMTRMIATLTGQGKMKPLIIAMKALHFKRLFDLCFSFFLLIIAAPLIALFGLVIWFETGLNPIFRQQRGLSLRGKRFSVLKIRTMYATPEGHHAGGVLLKDNLQQFVTPFGQFLRRSGLDELPQLINVLRGEMSFVGPRPLSITDLERISQLHPDLHHRRAVLDCKPGITGFWQLYGSREKGVEELLMLDEFYAHHASPLFDLFLCLKTIPIVCFAQHSDAIMDNMKMAGHFVIRKSINQTSSPVSGDIS